MAGPGSAPLPPSLPSMPAWRQREAADRQGAPPARRARGPAHVRRRHRLFPGLVQWECAKPRWSPAHWGGASASRSRCAAGRDPQGALSSRGAAGPSRAALGPGSGPGPGEPHPAENGERGTGNQNPCRPPPLPTPHGYRHRRDRPTNSPGLELRAPPSA